MLYLLQKLKVMNVVVMVSRWFGGIKLGSDRFKDFNETTQNALRVGGFLDEKEGRIEGDGEKKGKAQKGGKTTKSKKK